MKRRAGDDAKLFARNEWCGEGWYLVESTGYNVQGHNPVWVEYEEDFDEVIEYDVNEWNDNHEFDFHWVEYLGDDERPYGYGAGFTDGPYFIEHIGGVRGGSKRSTKRYAKNSTKKVALSTAKNKKLMEDIITYLYLHGLEEDVTFFTNGRRYCTIDWNGNGVPCSVNGFTYYDLGECNPKDYVEYGNPKTVVMTFEGDLYDEYDMGTKTVDDIYDIADKYGLFPEQGYAWSLSFFEK